MVIHLENIKKITEDLKEFTTKVFNRKPELIKLEKDGNTGTTP